MQCPVCKTSELQELYLEEHLLANACETCGGRWLSFHRYQEWLEHYVPSFPKPSFEDVVAQERGDTQVDDSVKAKICPECGHILLKYKVGPDLNFFVDRCNTCSGVWLDRNEWEVLKSRNLHDELLRIFTTTWQKHVQEEMTRENLEKFYVKKFGDATYQELTRIHEWLAQHPQRAELLAFLGDEDPYHIHTRLEEDQMQ
jgi:Zn-finger nucleic acid-binding protein